MGNFWRMLFLSCSVPQLFPITSVNLTDIANFWEIAKFATSQNWGNPGGSQ
jgi:hypothetical protein